MSVSFQLLRLVSPALPVGGFSYSRGLEQAVELGWVRDEASAAHWIQALLAHNLACVDAPAVWHIHQAFGRDDTQAIARWQSLLSALRDSAELHAEEHNMGRALAQLLTDLGSPRARVFCHDPATTYPTLFALAAFEWGVPADQAVDALLWQAAESQVSAAVRLIPLGQTAGQRILAKLAKFLPELRPVAVAHTEDTVGSFMPGLALASALHETQYSRLFRS